MIGSIGGLVFILVNAGGLPEPLPLPIRIAAVAAFALVVWFAVIRPSNTAASEPPTPRALRIYWICVGAEVLSIPLGASVINNVLDLPDITVCWVVLVVGAHFLPFARAFSAPIFTLLGWTLIGLAVAGGALTLATSAWAASATAVLAGAALLAFSALGSRTRRDQTVAGAAV